MYEVETIQIDEDNRLVVYVDEDTEDPREWGWGVEMHDIDDYRIWKGWEQPEDPVAYAAHVAQYNVRARLWTEEQRDRAIHIFKVWAGDDREFKVHEWRGYSQSDWATVLEVGENIGLYDAYAAWRRGDVFIVEHQQRVRLFTEDGEPYDMDDWEYVDSLGGCYLDDVYTAEAVGREHFEFELTQKVEK